MSHYKKKFFTYIWHSEYILPSNQMLHFCVLINLALNLELKNIIIHEILNNFEI